MRLLEHILLNVVKKGRDLMRKRVDCERKFVVSISARDHDLTVIYVARADFKTHGNAFHFPLVEFPARRLISVVEHNSHTCVAESGCDFLRLFGDAFFVRGNGNDDDLVRRDFRGKFETALVAVRHDECADKTGGSAPTRLIGVFELSVFVEIFNIERFREVLP